jgi:hypothetical protein
MAIELMAHHLSRDAVARTSSRPYSRLLAVITPYSARWVFRVGALKVCPAFANDIPWSVSANTRVFRSRNAPSPEKTLASFETGAN